MSVLRRPPVNLIFASPLAEAEARTRLEELGNGGPLGALRVRISGAEMVRANLVSQAPARFRGRLEASGEGCVLSGQVRQSWNQSFSVMLFAVLAVGLVIAAVAQLLAQAGRGRIGLVGPALLAGGIVSALVGMGLRVVQQRAFQLEVNRLSRAIGKALNCDPPQIPTTPLRGRTTKLIVGTLVALQMAALGARVGLGSGPLAGALFAAAMAVLLVAIVRVAQWSRPRLDGSVLRAGLQHVDLDRVTEVRARGSLMALSDGYRKVVVSSALGRPDENEAAADVLGQPIAAAPEPGSKAAQAARLLFGVRTTVGRCPLDPSTAAVLHRPGSPGEAPGHGPRWDPQALPMLAVMLGGMAVALVAIAAVR